MSQPAEKAVSYARKPETILARTFVDKVLKPLGVPSERIQAGEHKVRGGYLHCASAGTPDWWTPLCFIEMKQPGEDLSDDQIAWHEMARRWGQRVEVVQSVEQGARRIRELLKAREHERAMGWL